MGAASQTQIVTWWSGFLHFANRLLGIKCGLKSLRCLEKASRQQIADALFQSDDALRKDLGADASRRRHRPHGADSRCGKERSAFADAASGFAKGSNSRLLGTVFRPADPLLVLGRIVRRPKISEMVILAHWPAPTNWNSEEIFHQAPWRTACSTCFR